VEVQPSADLAVVHDHLSWFARDVTGLLETFHATVSVGAGAGAVDLRIRWVRSEVSHVAISLTMALEPCVPAQPPPPPLDLEAWCVARMRGNFPWGKPWNGCLPLGDGIFVWSPA
jgi:hypothetical protein